MKSFPVPSTMRCVYLCMRAYKVGCVCLSVRLSCAYKDGCVFVCVCVCLCLCLCLVHRRARGWGDALGGIVVVGGKKCRSESPRRAAEHLEVDTGRHHHHGIQGQHVPHLEVLRQPCLSACLSSC